MKINYCLHTHTSRCGHASGKDEDYVLKALDNGITTLGFSDHVFLKGIVQKSIRANFEELPDYINSINNLKAKYQGKIKILLGFEVEYAKQYVDYYKDLLTKYGFDYLILGQHFNFESPNQLYMPRIKEPKDRIFALNEYVRQSKEAMSSGLFLYFAHPDLYVTMYEDFNDECVNAANEICKTAEQYNIPLEINAHAIRAWAKNDKMIYPEEKFWEIASKYNVKVVIGYDAHNPNEFDQGVEQFVEIANKYHLTFANIEDYLK